MNPLTSSMVKRTVAQTISGRTHRTCLQSKVESWATRQCACLPPNTLDFTTTFTISLDSLTLLLLACRFHFNYFNKQPAQFYFNIPVQWLKSGSEDHSWFQDQLLLGKGITQVTGVAMLPQPGTTWGKHYHVCQIIFVPILVSISVNFQNCWASACLEFL